MQLNILDIPVLQSSQLRQFGLNEPRSWFWRCKPHPNPAGWILDKTDALVFEGLLDFHDGGEIALNDALALLDAGNGGQTNFRGLGQILLAPAEQSAGGPDLCRLQHVNECF